ncbi:MAG: hypothetical protein NTU43_07115 [Bacteroidetes bacterium]|nr:hypothetical protein [Bacteroidota bacterium]
MIKLTIVSVSILSVFITGCGCSGIECAACPGPPAIFYITSPIIQFDTTINNYKASDIDTLLLFKDEVLVSAKIPSDTFFNISNSISFSGVNLRQNLFLSDQSMAKFIKICKLETNLTEKGKGCCGCDKWGIKSINIDDSVYLINKLPVLIKK